MDTNWARRIVFVFFLTLPGANIVAAQEAPQEQSKEAQSQPSSNETTVLPEMIVAELSPQETIL